MNLQAFKIDRNFSTTVESVLEIDSNNTYLIGDWHLFHDNIIKYSQRPKNHQQILINKHNLVLKETDLLIFCGDISHGLWKISQDQEIQKKILKTEINKFNGRKILIKGNHDTFCDDYYKEIFEEVYDFITYKDVFISHYPIEKTKYNTPEQDLLIGIYNSTFLGYNVIHGHTHNRNNINSQIKHFNISCEAIEYSPIVLSKAIDQFDNYNDNLEGW